MRVASIALLVPLLACGFGRPPTPRPPLAPWRRFDRACARDDNPRHLERLHVARDYPRYEGDTRELLVVPVTVEPGLFVPRAWVVSGSERPDIEPFRWRLVRLANPGKASRATMGGTIQHVSQDRIILSFSESISVNTWVIRADIERRSGGELVATLSARVYSDISPWGNDRSDLAGELRLSAASWQEPNASLSVHLELSFGSSTTCEEFRFVVPAPGEKRSIWFPIRAFSTERMDEIDD